MEQAGPTPLSEADMDAARDIDRRFAEAFASKDLDAVMACMWDHPNLVVVLNGDVHRGPAAVRAATKQMLDQHESIRLEVNEVTVVPSGDGVVGVGTATFHLQPLTGPRQLLVERWSDVRRKVDGRWVYVLDHTTHVPVPGSETAASA